jgi:hypothetical protein
MNQKGLLLLLPPSSSPSFLLLKRLTPAVKEKQMAKTRQLTDRQHRIPSSIPAGEREGQRAVDLGLDRVTLAFRLGGVILGMAGCILGAWMPYSHPVARTLSVLWWGVSLGCLGGSLGVLACVLTERAPASPSRGPAVTGRPPTGATIEWPTRAAGPSADTYSTAVSELGGIRTG